MRLSLPLAFDRMEELPFRQTPDGWLFQAPNPWLVGRRRHYLVTDAQKAELTALLRGMWRNLTIAIIAVIVAGVPVALASGMDRHPIEFTAGAAAIGLVVGIAVVNLSMQRIRPLLGRLRPSEQQISRQDALRRQVEVFSTRHLVFSAILSFVLFAATTADAFFSSDGWDAMSVMAAVLFGSGTLYWVALYVAKRRGGGSGT